MLLHRKKMGLQIPRIQKGGIRKKSRHPARNICAYIDGLYIRED